MSILAQKGLYYYLLSPLRVVKLTLWKCLLVNFFWTKRQICYSYWGQKVKTPSFNCYWCISVLLIFIRKMKQLCSLLCHHMAFLATELTHWCSWNIMGWYIYFSLVPIRGKYVFFSLFSLTLLTPFLLRVVKILNAYIPQYTSIGCRKKSHWHILWILLKYQNLPKTMIVYQVQFFRFCLVLCLIFHLENEVISRACNGVFYLIDIHYHTLEVCNIIWQLHFGWGKFDISFYFFINSLCNKGNQLGLVTSMHSRFLLVWYVIFKIEKFYSYFPLKCFLLRK